MTNYNGWSNRAIRHRIEKVLEMMNEDLGLLKEEQERVFCLSDSCDNEHYKAANDLDYVLDLAIHDREADMISLTDILDGLKKEVNND